MKKNEMSILYKIEVENEEIKKIKITKYEDNKEEIEEIEEIKEEEIINKLELKDNIEYSLYFNFDDKYFENKYFIYKEHLIKIVKNLLRAYNEENYLKNEIRKINGKGEIQIKIEKEQLIFGWVDVRIAVYRYLNKNPYEMLKLYSFYLSILGKKIIKRKRKSVKYEILGD